MLPKMIFDTNVKFKELLHDEGSDHWIFSFEGDIYGSSSGFWRLLQDQEIVAVSADHGHKFGLPAPIDMVQRVGSCLTGQHLQRIEVCEGTGDLKFSLTGGYTIEIFTSSNGYETMGFAFGGKHYIGMGGGDYSLMDQE